MRILFSIFFLFLYCGAYSANWPTQAVIPSSYSYSSLNSNKNNQDFIRASAMYHIRGYVKDQSGNFLSDAVVTLSGISTGTYTTALDGYYEFTNLAYGTYTVVCTMQHWEFFPSDYFYNPLNTDKDNQNFTGTVITYYIKGFVQDTSQNKIANVTLTLTGDTTATYITDSSGYYEFLNLVSKNYIVTPTLQDWGFVPLNKVYNPLLGNEDYQNFYGIISTYSIEGYVKDSAGNPLTNVQLTINTGNSEEITSFVTDYNGYYKIIGLSPNAYIVTPSKNLWKFDPNYRMYLLLTVNQTNQNFVGLLGTVPQNDFKPINNLFNPLQGGKTTIWYTIVNQGNVKIVIYTMDGRLVKTLINEVKPAGTYTVEWTGVNNINEIVSRGVYIVYFEGPGFKSTKKIVVTK